MAFTAAQKVQIRKFLGFPQVYEGDNYRLEGAMTVIGADATKQAYVDGILTALEAVDALVASEGSSSASYGAIKRVDEVEFYDAGTDGTSVDTVTRGRMLVGRLSSALGVPVESNYFGKRGYSDDEWSRAASQIGGAFGLG